MVGAWGKNVMAHVTSARKKREEDPDQRPTGQEALAGRISPE